MKHEEEAVDPHVCPLCGGSNSCANPAGDARDTTCWCHDPALSFTQELIDSLPARAKGKVCICRSCAIAQQQNKKQRG